MKELILKWNTLFIEAWSFQYTDASYGAWESELAHIISSIGKPWLLTFSYYFQVRFSGYKKYVLGCRYSRELAKGWVLIGKKMEMRFFTRSRWKINAIPRNTSYQNGTSVMTVVVFTGIIRAKGDIYFRQDQGPKLHVYTRLQTFKCERYVSWFFFLHLKFASFFRRLHLLLLFCVVADVEKFLVLLFKTKIRIYFGPSHFISL